MPKSLLRFPIVKARSGQSRSGLYALIARGLWTRPVRLGARAVAWPEDEVNALNAARIAGLSDSEISALVTRLHAARSSALSLTLKEALRV